MSQTYAKYIFKHRKRDILLSDTCSKELQQVIGYFGKLYDCSTLISEECILSDTEESALKLKKPKLLEGEIISRILKGLD